MALTTTVPTGAQWDAESLLVPDEALVADAARHALGRADSAGWLAADGGTGRTAVVEDLVALALVLLAAALGPVDAAAVSGLPNVAGLAVALGTADPLVEALAGSATRPATGH